MFKKRNKLKIKKERSDAITPKRKTSGAAGVDFYCLENKVLIAGEIYKFETGIAVSFPKDYYLRIAPKSGLAAKNGIDVLGGVIDSDYRGTVKILLQNNKGIPVEFEKHSSIAQGILEKISTDEPVEVDSLDETKRGIFGFGSHSD